MATQIKRRRGSQSEIDLFTPAVGEWVHNTTDNSIHTGDGVKQGGYKIRPDSNEVVANVKHFGAKGDGVTDDTAAIQAAADAAHHVFFPEGTYMVSSIETTRSNIFFSFSRETATLKHILGSQFPLLWNRVANQFLEVENLSLLGTFANGAGTGNPEFNACGIWCSRGKLRVEHCDVRGFSANAIWTGNISDNWDINSYVEYVYINDCTVYNGDGTDLLGDCIRLERSNNVIVTNCDISGGLSGLRTQLYCKDMYFAFNHVYGSYADVGITVAHSSDITIVNNDCHSHFNHGIEADSCWKVIIQGNKCHQNDKHGILLSEYTTPGNVWYEGFIDGILVAPGETVWPKKVLLSDNTCFNNGKAGLQVTSPEECIVQGNGFWNNSRLDVSSNSNIRVDTASGSNFTQDVIIKENQLNQTSLCPFGISVTSYQFDAEKPIRAYNNYTVKGKLSDQPMLGSKNTIDFEQPNESDNSALVAIGDTDVEVTHGTYWVLTDPADPGQASLTWDTRVASVARNYLFRVKHRGDSDTVKLIVQEYSEAADGTQTFVRTLTDTTVGQSASWSHATTLVTSTENDDYNIIKCQYVTDDDTGATVNVADAELVPNN